MFYANGTNSSFAYTARGDLTDLNWNLIGGTNDLGYDFTYNGVGQLLTDAVNKASMQWTPPMIMTDTYAANNLNQYSSVNGVSP